MAVTASLSVDVLEGGTIIVGASFEDEAGSSVVPNTLTYTVLNEYEEVVNSLEDQTISPASSIEVTLSGNDLPAGKLYFIIEGTYDSDAGSGLPLKGYATFTVQRLPGA